MSKKEESKVDPNAWMNTYADMVTLLLTFFVLLYAQSSPDTEKMQIIMNAFAKLGASKNEIIINVEKGEVGDLLPEHNPGGESQELAQELPFEFSEIEEFLSVLIEKENLSQDMQIQSGNGYVFMRFKDSIVFGPDSYDITPKGQEILEYIGTGLKAVEGQTETIRINGHTASVPSVKDNAPHHRELSYRRALSVLNLFENKCDIKPEMMVPTGYGAYRPIVPGDTEEQRAQNRRVELLIIEKKSEEMDQTLADMIDLYFASEDFADEDAGKETP
ncbi:MAG: flagellar motor protein MotB [Oscillospiraceae bacterium]